MVPLTVPGVACSISTSPTDNSVRNKVPTPVTFLLPLEKVTVPVRFWIQLAAVFQLAAPVTRFVTVAAGASVDEKRPIAQTQKPSLRAVFIKNETDVPTPLSRRMWFVGAT